MTVKDRIKMIEDKERLENPKNMLRIAWKYEIKYLDFIVYFDKLK